MKWALQSLGVAALAIGASIFVFGPETVAGAFARLLWLEPPKPWTRDSDSEMRFYAVFWAAYGWALLSVAGSARNAHHVPLLLGLFFLGGVGRVISVLQVGMPHPLFIKLMMIELVLPVALYLLHLLARQRALDPDL